MRSRLSRAFSRIPAWTILAAIIALSAVFSILPVRCDLSPGKVYTVSPFSKETLSALDSEVAITWYRSRDLERMTPAIGYIDSFLEAYRAASGGRLSYTAKDPSLSDSTATIESLGIVPRQTSVRGKDGTSIKTLYSGLVIEYKGDYRSIPFLLDSKSLEYDLTRIILDLARPRSAETDAFREIQVIVGNASLKADYRYLDAWLSYAGFNPRRLGDPVVALDPRKKLLVLGSSDLDDATVGAIKAFLDKGGSGAFFVSGNEINAMGDWKARPKIADPLRPLLAARGISPDNGIAMDVLGFTVTLPALDNSRYAEIDYPFWVTVPRAGFTIGHPIFSGIESLQFFWPSPLAITRDSSGSDAFARATSKARIMLPPYDTNPFGGQKELLAANRDGSGTISAPALALVAASSDGARVVVIGDEWFPSTVLDYTGSESNLDFAVNCVEWISGEESLLALKNRRGPDELAQVSPFEPGEGSRNELSALHRARALNLVAIPAFLFSYIIIAALAKRRKR
jgi:ABC-type uncharacterized transport system involved in gliding motility auxiliary subunit